MAMEQCSFFCEVEERNVWKKERLCDTLKPIIFAKEGKIEK